MRNKLANGLGALLAWGMLAASGAGAARAGVVVDVYVFDFDVSANLPSGPIVDPVIMVGDTIRWVWIDDFHNVVSCVGQAESWESDIFAAGDTFVYQFTIPGVYQYYCSPHGFDVGNGTYEGMGGQITVLAVPGPSGAALLALTTLMGGRRSRRFRTSS